MSQEHEHDHPTVDLDHVRRFRFMKHVLDNLLDPENPNREQAYAAGLRMLDVLAALTANQTPTQAMNAWVFSSGLCAQMDVGLDNGQTKPELLEYFQIVEALSEMPLDGREEEWRKEQEELERQSKPTSMFGLVRLLTLIRTLPKRKFEEFRACGINAAQLGAARQLLDDDIIRWQRMGVKPHWFDDNLISLFRVSLDDLNAKDEEVRNKHFDVELAKIFALYTVRWQCPEGKILIKAIDERLQAASAAGELFEPPAKEDDDEQYKF